MAVGGVADHGNGRSIGRGLLRDPQPLAEIGHPPQSRSLTPSATSGEMDLPLSSATPAKAGA
jgi:hypothetical protein